MKQSVASIMWALTVTLSTIIATNAVAHELPSNRASLVLRDRQHLTITFFVDYAGVLHQALAPKKSLTEFLAQSAAMPEKEFKAQLTLAQERLQRSVTLTLAGGKPAALAQWAWPTVDAVQNQIQQLAMQAIVAPKGHGHGPQTEIRTEIRTEAKSANTTDFASIKLTLPAEFQQVLVVSYQPKQVWMKPNTLSPAITFE